MRLAGAIVGVLVASVVTAWAAAATHGQARPYVATCADSVYQTPASRPPETGAVLRLGPVIFNHLAAGARHDVTRPQRGNPFYSTGSFFNILTRAPQGVTIRLLGGAGKVAMLYKAYTPGDLSDQLRTGRLPLADAPRTVRFPLCHDPSTGAPLITQYGISFWMRKPGCFTLEVQPVDQSRRFRATVRVLVRHC